jgi:hypothetical protein
VKILMLFTDCLFKLQLSLLYFFGGTGF